jgi:hypothetical protein
MARADRGQEGIVHVQGRKVLVTDHQYTSTACHHERHQECRFTCKFCDAICQCLCHSMVNAKFITDHWNEAFDALGYTKEWAMKEVS